MGEFLGGQEPNENMPLPESEIRPTPEIQPNIEEERNLAKEPKEPAKEERETLPPSPPAIEIRSSDPAQNEVIRAQTTVAQNLLDGCYDSDRGLLYTSGDPNSQFYAEIWARDTMFGCATFIARDNPARAIGTLEHLLSFQKPDGTLPIRIEYKRHWANYAPILGRVKSFVSRQRPFPVYESAKLSLSSRDTVPSIIIGAGELFRSSTEGRAFIAQKFEQLQKALIREEMFADPADGLIAGGNMQDWADSIRREGKLADTNILYFRSLREMSFMAGQLDKNTEAEEYGQKAVVLKERILANFWDEEDGFIKAGIGDNRLDTAANIFACLYLVDAQKAARVQDALKTRAMSPIGLLKNFDPPYPHSLLKSQIAFRYRIYGVPDYHNECVWPWLTTENILAKITIFQNHSDEQVRSRFAQEARDDFAKIAALHQRNGDFYEMLNNRDGTPLRSHYFGKGVNFAYKSSRQFLGTITSFLVAKRELQKAHLLESESTK